MGCAQCKPKKIQEPLPDVRNLSSRSREHLSPEAADRYLEFAHLLAKWSAAQYVSVVYQDVEHGLGGLTYNACSGPASLRCKLHLHCMQVVRDEEVPVEVHIESDVKLADQTWNRITCPIPGVGRSEGMICMFSEKEMALTKADLRLLGVISELFNGEVNALHGNMTGSAIVIFDASVTGWKSVCTSFNWRKITGIRDGDDLTSVFDIPEDNTIPVTGIVSGQKREFGFLWHFCLELQPARQIDGQQLWIGTVLSATDVSLETAERQISEVSDQNEAIQFLDIKVDCLLGKGGFGSVHRAVWQGRSVAVKILEDCGRPTTEVIQEAKIGQRLHHLNLVETIASGVDYRDNGDKFTWIMMELCTKGTLWQTIECGYFRDSSSDSIDMSKYLRTANHIVDGLKYLHENNILHGDLNCNNVLMSDEVTAKISDLGLSRVFAGNTLATDTYGTISHQPPELLSTGQLSFSSDIYSFGVILYEMFVGERAYHGLRFATIMSQKIDGHMLELPQKADETLRGLVSACLVKEHRARPTLSEIHEWLSSVAR